MLQIHQVGLYQVRNHTKISVCDDRSRMHICSKIDVTNLKYRSSPSKPPKGLNWPFDSIFVWIKFHQNIGKTDFRK